MGIRVHFFGAAREVTGSCFLVETGTRRILIDCGLIQGAPADEARNRTPFPFAAGDIDAVVLTHAHLDHSGRLPVLVGAGYKGPIFTHRASRDLVAILLKDAAYIAEKEAGWENRKRQRKHLPPVEPLYTVAEAHRVMGQFRTLNYDEDRELVPGVRLRLRDAGHILGSAIVELTVQSDSLERRLVFSGDLGHQGAPILRDPEIVDSADLVVMESTYGDRCHRGWDETWQELAEVFATARHDKGNVLIPSFAVGRTQDLLFAFNKFFDDWSLGDWRVFIDSPMAIETTEVYARHTGVYDRESRHLNQSPGSLFELPNLHLSRTADDSMRINRMHSGAVVIAGSGMCDGGRIKHHLKHNVWRRNCHLVFVGFQARGTLGRRIVDGAERIRLWGETVRVAAQVHTVGGLSAHADRDGLVNWCAKISNRPPVVLVHGEPMAMDPLAVRLRDQIGAKVLCPEPQQMLDLDRLTLSESPLH